MPELLLDDEEVQVLRRLLDRIIPADDVPGAVDAGADAFILRLLAQNPGWSDTYRAGLILWRTVSPEDLDATLAAREGDPFVRLLIQHAMEGFYGDPGQGGNRNGVSWQMVGFRVTA